MTTVLGGGLSGLSAGFYLLRRFKEPVTIYEASHRLGGWIRSERQEEKGFVFEAGPRTIRPKGEPGANTLELIEELELPLEAIQSQHVAARNRMIFAKGQLCMLPNSFWSLFKTMPPFTMPLIKMLFNDLRSQNKSLKLADESIYDFAKRRFGVELAQYAISPMICGICAGDAKEISVRFLMDDLFEKEQRWGGVLKGLFYENVLKRGESISTPGIFATDSMPSLYQRAVKKKWSMYGIQNGLETLPRTLGDYLRKRDVQIELKSECREMIFQRKGVKMNIKGQEVNSQHVVCAIPSYKLAPCVREQHPSLTAQLLAIPYVDVAVVNLQYDAKDLQKLQAFGLLVPPIERKPILGIIFDSCCFDMRNNTVLTVMMGGRWFETIFGKQPTHKQLLDTALQEVEHILGIDVEPQLSRVHILRNCIPQYTVGHKHRVANIRRYIERYNLPLLLCGAAYDGVGINDVILSARRQVDALPININ